MKPFFLILLFGGILCSGAADHRPAFDKSSYKGTLWTQVNPWWHPAKQRIDDSGGPNYAMRDLSRSPRPWGDAFAEANKRTGMHFQIELHVPAPGFADGMKKMMKEAKISAPDAKFAIFMVWYGKKNLEKDIAATIRQLDMLRDEFKNDPAIFRVDGRPVISVYTAGYFTPEEWGKVIPAVEAKCGRFIWLFNTCRNPALDADPVKGAEYLRSLLPYFDGVSAYGNYSSDSQQKQNLYLSRIMREEFPHKIFEASVQNAYSNHFHFGGVATKLSEKFRRSFDTVIGSKPDSIVMTNFFDHYENSLILPCYEREDFLLRYAAHELTKIGNKNFVKEKRPELVVTSYTTILLGAQHLDFEVIAFPIDAPQKKLEATLILCDDSGKELMSFPRRSFDLDKLSVAEYSVPSTRFADCRAVTAYLKYRWNNRDFKTRFMPITLISPSLRSNLMFYARSSRNEMIVHDSGTPWRLDNVPPGGTLAWPKDGLVTVSADVKPAFGNDPKQGTGAFRVMRNGLEHYRLARHEGMSFTRAFALPSPGDALNYYHMEFENSNGFRYQTLPVWVTNNHRPGKTALPVWGEDDKIHTLQIEKARIPYFYYPCDRDTGLLMLDHSGYMHNGRISGTGYGGGHLGYTGYYHYHTGGTKVVADRFYRDGALQLNGKDCVMVMGGTAFPGAATYELSVKPEKFGKLMGLLGTANNQINLAILPDGKIRAWRGSEAEGAGGIPGPRKSFTSTVVTKEPIKAGQWTRIAVVFDLKTIKLYIDGKLAGETAAGPRRYHAFINHLTVGSLCQWVWTPKDYFTGSIRDIRFYGRNLAPEEFLPTR